MKTRLRVRARITWPFVSARTLRGAVAAVVAATMVLAGCGSNSSKRAGDAKLRIVTSFYPLAYAAERVGGDRVWVTNLTPAGVEPHDLELSSDAVDKVESADLVVVMGRNFQPAVEKAASRRKKPSINVLNVLLSDDPSFVGKVGPDQEPGGLDPHVWLDPTLMVKLVETLRIALTEADPSHESTYRSNATALTTDLHTLDGQFRTGLARCARTVIVTSHDAFGRMATRYGLRQEAIAGVSPDQEPDAARLAELAKLVKREAITTIFFEALVPKAVAQTVAREAGVKTALLSPIEGLSKTDIAAGRDYLSVMRTNLAALRAALDCQ